jgi:hypothetical protein
MIRNFNKFEKTKFYVLSIKGKADKETMLEKRKIFPKITHSFFVMKRTLLKGVRRGGNF